MIESLQAGNLFEPEVSDSNKGEENTKTTQVHDFLSQFSEMQDKNRLYSDNLFKTNNNVMKDPKSDKYQKFIGKFKR